MREKYLLYPLSYKYLLHLLLISSCPQCLCGNKESRHISWYLIMSFGKQLLHFLLFLLYLYMVVYHPCLYRTRHISANLLYRVHLMLDIVEIPIEYCSILKVFQYIHILWEYMDEGITRSHYTRLEYSYMLIYILDGCITHSDVGYICL